MTWMNGDDIMSTWCCHGMMVGSIIWKGKERNHPFEVEAGILNGTRSVGADRNSLRYYCSCCVWSPFPARQPANPANRIPAYVIHGRSKSSTASHFPSF